MAEERTIGERLGVVEAQLDTVRQSLVSMQDGITKLTEAVLTSVKANAVVEARLIAFEKELSDLVTHMNQEFVRGREHMARTDAKVEAIKQKCDQTESLRISGQKHLDEASKEMVKTSEAWISSGTAMKIVLAFMGLVTFLIGLVLYMLSKGASGIPGS